MGNEYGANESRQGKPKHSENTFSGAMLSAINPTLPELGRNPGHSGGMPVTNHLSYGTAQAEMLEWLQYPTQINP
jgi:hypothetical protein